MSELFPLARRATLQDAINVLNDLREFLNKFDYHVAVNGSTIHSGEGNDIDLLITAGITATASAIKIANKVVRCRAKLILNFEIYGDEDQFVGFSIWQKDGTTLDAHVHGISDEGV